MDIPRYWVKEEGEGTRPDGQSIPLACWNWSETSEAHARERALAALSRMAQRIASGEDFPDKYGYGARAMREEILRELPGRDGSTAVALTRNAYGAVILNAAEAMFVDVDDLPPEGLVGRGLRALFGRKKTTVDPLPPAILAARAWAEAEPGIALRVYRTAAGYRILVTHDVFDPKGERAHSIMERLGSDPRYRQLCRAQGCFRARLTPKPWRLGIPNPPRRDPFKDPQLQPEMNTWLEEYDSVSGPFAVCHLIETLGRDDVHPNVAPVLALHDEFVLRDSKSDSVGVPLA